MPLDRIQEKDFLKKNFSAHSKPPYRWFFYAIILLMSKSNKDKIRKILLHKRSLLTKQEQKQKSSLIINNIKQSDEFKHAQNIAFYHAVRGEADPYDLMPPYSTNPNKNFYLPIISLTEEKSLVFAPINDDTQYKNNHFSIPEPIVESSELISAKDLDLVIMPLLGFDNRGNRLGMGGGYYDRSFSFKQSKIRKPILLGFAYDFQQVDLLIPEKWDIGLDILATESQFVHFYHK